MFLPRTSIERDIDQDFDQGSDFEFSFRVFQISAPGA